MQDNDFTHDDINLTRENYQSCLVPGAVPAAEIDKEIVIFGEDDIIPESMVSKVKPPVCSYIVPKVTHSQWGQVTLPGYLGVPKHRCGALSGFVQCRSCGEWAPYVVHCDSINCPVCYRRAISKAVDKAVQRLHGFKRVVGLDVNPRHMWFSKREWAEMDYDQMQKSVRNMFSRELKGADGVYVIHWYRVNKDTKPRIKAILEEDNRSGSPKYHGAWDILRSGVLGDICDNIHVSPHIHFMGYCWLPPSNEFYDKTGIYYHTVLNSKNHADRYGRDFLFEQQPGSFGFSNEVSRTLTYLLTHCAVKVGASRQILIRPVGRMSQRFLKRTNDIDTEVRTPIHCPRCDGFDLQRGDFDPNGVGYQVMNVSGLPWFRYVWDKFVVKVEGDEPDEYHRGFADEYKNRAFNPDEVYWEYKRKMAALKEQKKERDRQVLLETLQEAEALQINIPLGRSPTS